MNHTMKLWNKVIEHCLREIMRISMNRFEFMLKSLTVEAIFLIRQVMEQYREQKNYLNMILIDLKKAYDKIPKNIVVGFGRT
jgi:hypothetical protein